MQAVRYPLGAAEKLVSEIAASLSGAVRVETDTLHVRRELREHELREYAGRPNF